MKRVNVYKSLKSLLVKRLILKREKHYKFNQNYNEWVLVKRLPPLVKRLIPISQTTNGTVSQLTTYKRKKEIITKEIDTTNVVLTSKARKLPKETINEVIRYLKERLKIDSLEGTDQDNRRYANHLINRLAKMNGGNEDEAVEWIKKIIDVGLQGWHQKNITGFKYLFNNYLKIIGEFKTKQPVVFDSRIGRIQ